MNRITPKLCLWLMAALCCAQSITAQQAELDSLSALLRHTKQDTTAIRLLKRIVFIWTDMNVDSATAYIDKLRKLGKTSNDAGAIIYADVKLAELHNMNGNYADAMKVNNANLDYANAKGTPYQRADVYKTIAMSYSMQERNDSALTYYLKALQVYESSNDSLGMARVMVNIAVSHSNMGDTKKAIAYCERARDIFRGKDIVSYLVTLTNLALYQGYDKQYAAAERHYNEALQIAKSRNTYNSLAHIYSGLTDIAYLKGNYAAMLPHARSFEDVGRQMQNDYILLRAQLAMGKALFYNHQFDQAERYFTIGLQQTSQLEDNKLLREIFVMYSYLLLLKHNDVATFDVYRRKIDSLDALSNSDLITRTTKELETRFETGKKNDQLKLQAADLRQQQLLNYSLGGAIVALCVIGFVSFHGYRSKQKVMEQEKVLQQQQIAQLEKDRQLAATQAVLQGQEEERTRLAKDLHDSLGGMLSGVKFSFSNMKENLVMTAENQQAFSRNMDMLDGIVHELRRVAHNMMPESLMKFGLDDALRDMCNYVQQSGALKVSYQSLGLKNVSVDKNVAIHIYRIVQELLNNVMKHAKATAAIVQVGYNNGHFSITVEDNGHGFNTAFLERAESTKGMGWANIRNRVHALKGNMDVQSSAQKGTSVFIEFNIAA
ncbi:MAG TPA: tetratricopeptide repeat protein [Chitinophagaceae bacterium]|nr:tetratricopeptide repeat protein [Chitinophagaceae bacterium]